MTRASLVARRLVVAAAVALTLPACARTHAAPSEATETGAPFDVATMAFLSEARALHHEANVAEQEGDLPHAIAAVGRIVRAKRPHGTEPTPEVEEVVADACARLAELELRAGDSDAASRAASEGLVHAPTTTYFRGHLLEVQGMVDEARGAALADAGDEAGAARARSNAARWLEQAVAVQERVIEASLDGGATGEPDAR